MKIMVVLLLLLLLASVVNANVSLPDVLSSGMVVQRDKRVPIWGKAEPGESISVKFGRQSKQTIADKEGKWLVYLNPLKSSSTPAVLTIEGKNKVELKDILVGEVWLVAGQSNMQRILSETANGEQAIAGANHPEIRLFNVSRQVAFKHAPRPLATWQVCAPESVRQFSAAGYYFAVELQRELKVPIGVINSSYGGSQAEAWTPV